MTIENINSYIDNKKENGLVKIVITTEDDTCGRFIVSKTKEEYVFLDEEGADALIDEARQDRGFISAKKKYKAGKISKKSGEIVTPETWTVVIELNH